MPEHGQTSDRGGAGALIAFRVFAWSVVATTFTFVLNNYLTCWRNWPGVDVAFSTGWPQAGFVWAQIAIYVAGIAAAAAYVLRTSTRPLRQDSAIIYSITAFIIRAAFWAVLLIGIADAVISFLRVENLLVSVVGDQLAVDLSRPTFRGYWVHFPMLFLGIVLAIFKRGLGFPWLSLLVVVAELLIVFTRFIFSYEQAFMADLVRFWYAALFLFASAYTLLEEGHVRVDVLYAAFSERTKGLVNAIGCVLLGMSLCAVTMLFGMGSRSAIINAPLVSFEVTATGFGMYVKYWMAGFLGIFAISMMIQFAGYFLESIADYRGEPGKRVMDSELAQDPMGVELG